MNIKELILNDRLKRSENVGELLKSTENFLVTIKANIVGDDKNIKEAKMLVKYFYQQVCNNFDVINTIFYQSYDGDYYIVEVTNKDYVDVKKRLVELEDGLLGRFIDLDLFANREYSLSRTELGLPKRRCIVCNDEYGTCLGKRLHSVEETLECTIKRIREELVEILHNYVVSSMEEEVVAEPKFGLVTKNSTGSHTDMNYDTFISSIQALKPSIKEYLYEGFNLNDETFKRLRQIGIDAERRMFEATNGVNTHKGAIFLLGFLLPVMVDVIYNNKHISDAKESIRFLAKDILNDLKDLDQKEKLTYGEELYLKYGITGVRGIVFDGMSVLFDNINSLRFNDQYISHVVKILLFFMERIDDTTILHRHPIEMLDVVKSIAKECNEVNMPWFNQDHTERFIERKMSPGGSADMTIMTLIVLKIIDGFKMEV